MPAFSPTAAESGEGPPQLLFTVAQYSGKIDPSRSEPRRRFEFMRREQSLPGFCLLSLRSGRVVPHPQELKSTTRDWVSDVEFLQRHVRPAASLSLTVRVYNLQAIVGIGMPARRPFGHHRKFSLHPVRLEPVLNIGVPVLRVLSLADRVDSRGELQLLTRGFL